MFGNNKVELLYDLHIIIPAYNVEKYIEDCINSILEQKTKYSYFISIIDDGSKDLTFQKLQKYSQLNNVSIIHQENGGVSKARNKGLEIIKGKYISFVDSDDILCPNAIESLLNKAYEYDADIVEGSSYKFNDNWKSEPEIFKASLDENDYAIQLRGMPWGKVIKSTIFENLKYPEGYDFEDSIFAYCIYPKYQRKYLIPNCVYGYRVNGISITRRIRKSYKSIDHYWLMGYLWDYSNKNNLLDTEAQKRMLGHFSLGYSRTSLLEDIISESGFVYLRELYMSLFEDKATNNLTGVYKEIDKMVREKNYGMFRIFSKQSLF